ncbi:MYCBP-associated protein [Silurus asotus]|uniref:MYCBP-associated protein n=1 Tax=Silurus asotus TaxID=30991 RepID=A0AAD5AUX1_SILAS|nr:MYCBP-associated protein [Silurus asotus]
MAGVRRASRTSHRDSRAPEISPPDKKEGKVSEERLNVEQGMSAPMNREDLLALSIRPEHLEKLRPPQPPKDSQKPRATSRVLVRKTRPPEDPGTGVKVAMAKLLPKNAEVQSMGYTEDPGGPRFDAHGMVLPHSILGSLEDFRNEMKAKGEIELMNRIPDGKKQALFDFEIQKPREKTKSHAHYEQDHQRHALNHWCQHMAERRRQQNFISNLLQKPVEDLLMNQSNRFRETQEQRALISRGLPALYNGHGARVGSEFWSVPLRFGDELSGIMATLTQEERGYVKPITHIKQPHSTRVESSNVLCERSASKAWSHSQYLKQRQNELRNILKDLDFNQPEMDLLEIVGSYQPFTSESVNFCRKQEQEDRSEGDHKENEDPLALFDDVMLEVELLPALRINGELARWNESTNSHQGEIGVSVCMMFEAVVGESTCSHLELKNEGSTAIYYSWQKLELPHSFPEATTHAYSQQFYFDTSSAVILPGDTEKILFIFKSGFPGIMTEAWKLHTHPVLMDGAMLQVTLKGMALYQDQTSEQRVALEVVMSLPAGDDDIPEQKAGLNKEEALSQYNTLLMQLHQSQPASIPLTVQRIGLQLWREVLDGLVSEALRLRRLLGLPENDVWEDTETESEEQPEKMEMMEQDSAPVIKEKEEKSGAVKPAAKDKPAEVYILMEKMIDSLEDLLTEAHNIQENQHNRD